MISEPIYMYDKIFNEKKKQWDAARLAEQREIARIMGLPEPQAVLTPRESERTFGKAPEVKPVKATANPYRRLASKEHRQNNTLRKALGGSPAPAPSAPAPGAPAPGAPKPSKTVKVGGVVFAGSVTEIIDGAGR